MSSRKRWILALSCLLVWTLATPHLQAACATYDEGAHYPVAFVFDGDTLQLKDGRNVRLIGLNSPEMGHDGEQDEPHAPEAKAHLEYLIRDGGGRVYLRLGEDRQDRYRRSLAHTYAGNGKNLTEQMLAAGMGYHITIPPNLVNLSCYADAEERARTHRLGLWQHPSQSGTDLLPDAEGFHLVRGRVQRVGHSRHNVWINLEGALALRIQRDDLRWFEGLNLDELQGRDLEARGWIYRHKGQRRMRVRHPTALRIDL